MQLEIEKNNKRLKGLTSSSARLNPLITPSKTKPSVGTTSSQRDGQEGKEGEHKTMRRWSSPVSSKALSPDPSPTVAMWEDPPRGPVQSRGRVVSDAEGSCVPFALYCFETLFLCHHGRDHQEQTARCFPETLQQISHAPRTLLNCVQSSKLGSLLLGLF